MKENGTAAKVEFVVNRYANEFRKMTKSQQEQIRSVLETLFSWRGKDGYTIAPTWVQILYLREPVITLHWRCWADVAWSEGYRWRFEELGPVESPIGSTIYFWHKDESDKIYTFRMRYKDYESKIKRWAQMDFEVMVCKTLLRNAIAFFAPHLAAREPFAMVATFDETDLPASPAPAEPPVSNPDFRQIVKEIMIERGLEAETVKTLLATNFNARRLEDLTPEQKQEFLEMLRS